MFPSLNYALFITCDHSVLPPKTLASSYLEYTHTRLVLLTKPAEKVLIKDLYYNFQHIGGSWVVTNLEDHDCKRDSFLLLKFIKLKYN